MLALANLRNTNCHLFSRDSPRCLLAHCCACCTRWLLVAIHAAPLSRNPQIKMLLTKPFFFSNRVLLAKSHYGSPRGDVFPSSQVLCFPLVFIFIFFWWRTVEERLGYLGLGTERIQIDNREPAVRTVGVENRAEKKKQRIYQTEVVGGGSNK